MCRIALMLLLLAAPAWGKTLTWSFSSDLQTLTTPSVLWGHARH